MTNPTPPAASDAQKCETCGDKGFLVSVDFNQPGVDVLVRRNCPDCAPPSAVTREPERPLPECIEWLRDYVTQLSNAVSAMPAFVNCEAAVETLCKSRATLAHLRSQAAPPGENTLHTQAVRDAVAESGGALPPSAPLALTEDLVGMAEKIEALNGFNKGRAERELLLDVAATLRALAARGGKT